MPMFKYLAVIGAVLLGLLFVTDAVLTKPAPPIAKLEQVQRSAKHTTSDAPILSKLLRANTSSAPIEEPIGAVKTSRQVAALPANSSDALDAHQETQSQSVGVPHRNRARRQAGCRKSACPAHRALMFLLEIIGRYSNSEWASDLSAAAAKQSIIRGNATESFGRKIYYQPTVYKRADSVPCRFMAHIDHPPAFHVAVAKSFSPWASLAALTGRARTIFRAGFALNTVGSSRKRIDPLTFFRRRLFDDDELGKARKQEGPGGCFDEFIECRA